MKKLLYIAVIGIAVAILVLMRSQPPKAEVAHVSSEKSTNPPVYSVSGKLEGRFKQ